MCSIGGIRRQEEVFALPVRMIISGCHLLHAKYITVTGDRGILDEVIPFLEGRLLNAGEESYYDLPIRSDITASFI